MNRAGRRRAYLELKCFEAKSEEGDLPSGV